MVRASIKSFLAIGRAIGSRRSMAMLAPSETWQLNSSSPSPSSLNDLDDSPARYQELLTTTVERLLSSSRAADADTYLSILARIADAGALAHGRRIHAFISKLGCDPNRNLTIVLCGVIRMYGCCGSVLDARDLFDFMPGKGPIEWNTMLVVYTQNGHLEPGMDLLQRMPLQDVVTWNTTIAAMLRNGHVREAKIVFDQIPERSVASWNTLITHYAENGDFGRARRIFEEMLIEGVAPGPVTFLGALGSCGGAASLRFGRMLHERILEARMESNVRVASAIVSMYGRCGSIAEARATFDRLPNRNRVTWNGMLAAYAQNGHSIQALEFFHTVMRRERNIAPNRITFLSLLEACSNLSALEEGRSIHSSIRNSPGLESNPKVVSALVTMYAKCGELHLAKKVFDECQSWNKDAIAWTAMILAYARNGHPKEAIRLLPLMDSQGIHTDKVTFVNILDACGSITDVKLGRSLHKLLEEEQAEMDVHLGTSIVGMYGRCGSLVRAREIFHSMREKDTFTWNTIIAVHSHNGDPRGALEFFRLMELQGERPDRLTCTCVLAACGHAGLVADARYHFVSMRESYGVEAGVDHYACMADLLARSGKLEQAEELIHAMPFEPHIHLWTSLLGACNVHKNVEIGIRVSKHVDELLPDSSCGQVMLRNVLLSGTRKSGSSALKVS
ncbi:pentatricopeptide repeat-containing protein At2g13600 [Selaginella moellendorffii]|nr:pentatricopeptide repeat-containing protein At2g13600 [Selaginella moellendorffii]XP_024538560.1 pentatricopeptide repeat-containing protein At2g13600 [Selaginella moellendorffii]XP_024538561.1 pentatricopeptide repeat-containing protein At2g13600 [Selaginella moellendorffii]|eukprot:XP_024538559.1 pentatricopeptide repeat-containing protein At2g13600 [Selaginella moellendorffii]